MRIFSCFAIVALSMLVAPTASAQVSRVALDSKHCPHGEYVDVYEYDFVDVQPAFPGDERGLINYINSERKYPYDAYKKRIQGRVLCSFVIDVDGKVCNVTVLRGAYPSLDKEAVRIIKDMPEWKPGKMNGVAVPVRYILPIPFRL